jgi:hypothetical protein
MKKLLVTALCAVSLNVSAQSFINVIPTSISVTRFVVDLTDKDSLENTPPVVVQASGTGETCDQALLNAKRNALEKVNGSWVRSVERSQNGLYEEDIVQYSGGVVKSYKYLRDDCKFVIIEAEVMKRSNRVQMEAADISKNQIIHIQGIKESLDRKKQAVSKLNSRSDAIFFKPKNTSMRVIEGTNDVAVSIDGVFAYKDKWRADYLELREQFGYFNLTAFESDARIKIVGYDSARNQVFSTSFVHSGDWKLWGRKTYGASPTMEVYTHRTEEVKVKFRVPMDKLDNVRSFIVEVI